MRNDTTTFDLGALLARAALALLFIPSGLGKVAGFSGAVAYISSKGLPLPEIAAAAAIAAELGLGALLLLGVQTRWAALGLALFVAVATPVFHNFWGVPAEQVMVQKLLFWKNIGLLGGLMLLSAAGGGRWSLGSRDAGSRRRQAAPA
jgi:putative oxidoreductase